MVKPQTRLMGAPRNTSTKSQRGAKPSDLPIPGPVKFNLTVNLKTAKALGLSIPKSFLLCADKVIK